VTGEGSDRRAAKRSGSAADDRLIVVELEHGRWRHGGWALVGLVLGGVVVWKLGMVAKGLGAILIAVGLYHLVRFGSTLRHPAGAIRVGDDGVRLPRGVCTGDELVLAQDQIRHAYFLRRAVPWTQTGPVLVVEIAADHGARALLYPRDWFASDADQRRVARALNRRLGRLP
jgi:hypothetical protein